MDRQVMFAWSGTVGELRQWLNLWDASDLKHANAK